MWDIRLEMQKAIKRQEHLTEFEKEPSSQWNWLIHLRFKYLLNRTHFLMLLSSYCWKYFPSYCWKLFTSVHLWHQPTKVHCCNYICSRQNTDITSSSNRVACYCKLWDNQPWGLISTLCLTKGRSLLLLFAARLYWHMETLLKRKKKQNYRRKKHECQMLEDKEELSIRSRILLWHWKPGYEREKGGKPWNTFCMQ